MEGEEGAMGSDPLLVPTFWLGSPACITGPPLVGQLGSHWWVVLLTGDPHYEKGLWNEGWSPALITCISPPKRICCILTHAGHGLAFGDTGGAGSWWAFLLPDPSTVPWPGTAR